MEKLKTSKKLSRQEMKAINGGFHRCDPDYVCGPPCPDPWGPGGQSTGWFCDGGIGGTCKPVTCYYY